MKLEKQAILESWMDEYNMPVEDLEFDEINDYDGSEVILYDVDNQTEIMRGDWYHNKINDKIKGFIECLEYLKINYSINKIVVKK